MNATPTWTDDKIKLLSELWSEGYSASQIAAKIGGVSRNAVIGKVHRLGLQSRKETVAKKPRPQRTPASSKTSGRSTLARQPTIFRSGANLTVAFVEEAEEEIIAPLISSNVVPAFPRITLLELNTRTCKWPIGDPTRDDFRFCGATIEAGKVYCSYHACLAYQRPAVKAK